MLSRALSTLLAALAGMLTPKALALNLGVGLAAVDDMGDRAQPAATIDIGWTKDLDSRLLYWGRDYGPVSERSAFLTLCAKQALPNSKFLSGRYGLVAMVQKTSLYARGDVPEGVETPAPEHETAYNLGGVLGVGLTQTVGRFRAELSWDSHIFMVAGPAIIFLPSARKQVLAATFGVEI